MTCFFKLKRTRRKFLFALAFLLFFFLLLFSRKMSVGIRNGLSLYVGCVFPAVFPFLIFSDFFLAAFASPFSDFAAGFSRALRISPAVLLSFFFGAVCGFPLGFSVLRAALRQGWIDEGEAARALPFCALPSPAFTVFAVGGMFGSLKIGLYFCLLLFLLHLFALLLVFRFQKRQNEGQKQEYSPPAFSFTKGMANAVKTALATAGFIAFFSGVCELFRWVPPHFRGVIFSLFEMTSATHFCAVQTPVSSFLPVCAFSLCFGGISVLFQGKYVFFDTNVSFLPYFVTKLLLGTAASVLIAFFGKFWIF